jgi:glycosyltransferase involved in cell wall biosynthesis
MLEQVCKHIAETWTSDRPLIFLVLGSQDADQQFGEIQVRHIPFQSDSTKVARFYQAADIFIHAAKSDNFPNTILEAFACGKPVIATDVGGISEQIDEGGSGYLIPPSDVSAMAFRITQLLQDKALRDRLGRQASEIARQRFDLKIQTATYLAWYQEIIERWKEIAAPIP